MHNSSSNQTEPPLGALFELSMGYEKDGSPLLFFSFETVRKLSWGITSFNMATATEKPVAVLSLVSFLVQFPPHQYSKNEKTPPKPHFPKSPGLRAFSGFKSPLFYTFCLFLRSKKRQKVHHIFCPKNAKIRPPKRPISRFGARKSSYLPDFASKLPQKQEKTSLVLVDKRGFLNGCGDGI